MVEISDLRDFMATSDKELLGDLLKNRPKGTDGLESVIIVDGVPKVGPERAEKLKNVLHELYSKFGNIVTVDYPLDENGVTKGYVLFEFASPENAIEAVKSTNGYKLDKHHVFDVNLLTDFAKYKNIPDEWEPPTPQPYIEHGNLRYQLQESDACDQYSVMCNGRAKTSIYLNTTPEPSLLQERERKSPELDSNSCDSYESDFSSGHSYESDSNSSHSDNIKEYVDDSMLEDPWKDLMAEMEKKDEKSDKACNSLEQ